MTREDFLARIRGALHRPAGAPAEAPPAPLPPAPLERWEPADLIDPFTTELEAVGGSIHRAPDLGAARRIVAEVARESGAHSWIRSSDDLVDEVAGALELPLADDPAAADLGVTGARWGLADTGTLVLTSDAGRVASLLPMTHLALLPVDRLAPTMAEALASLDRAALPSAWVQATGPSRTADIEMTLSTGVHGPGVVHVVLIG